MTGFKMLLARFSAVVFGLALLCCFTERVWAQFVEPVGTFQEIFVTGSPITTGASNSISTYNNWVTLNAASFGSFPAGTTWDAVASTASVAANVNAPSGSYPIYNTAGQLVSVGNSIYSGSLANPVGYDAAGNPVGESTPVWTGSNADGTAATGQTLGTAFPVEGNPTVTGSSWLVSGTSASSNSAALYALSGPITNNVAAAGGGTGTVGGVSTTFADVTSPGVFTSTYSAVANDPTDLTNALGATAYASLRSLYPPGPIGQYPIQLFDMGFTGTSTGLNTVTVHIDPTLYPTRPLAPNFEILHYEGGSWYPPKPVGGDNPYGLDLIHDTLTFQTESFSPFIVIYTPEPSSLVLLGCGLLGFAAAALWRRSRKAAAVVFGVAILCCNTERLWAQFVEPVGTFQEIFVTGDTTTGTSSSISTYNSFVASEAAQNSALPGPSQGVTWTAVASTASVAANVNAPTGSYPVYDTGGYLVSVDNSIYTGSLASPITYTQFVNGSHPQYALTGSNADGSAATGQTLGSGSVIVGNSEATNSTWLDGASQSSSSGFAMYALSSPITNNVAAAGGGTGTVGGVSTTFADVTSPGVFSSTYSAVANDPTDLTNALGATAYAALRSSVYFPPVPTGWDIQLFDMGFTGTSTGLNTVTVHIDPTLFPPRPIAPNFEILHYEGGSWFPPAPSAVTITLMGST